MSGDGEGSAQCAAIADDLPELAFGTLSGRRRSEVLRHAGSCPRCYAELGQLASVAEALQQLAPQMQPPLGFELRLAERLRRSGRDRARRDAPAPQPSTRVCEPATDPESGSARAP